MTKLDKRRIRFVKSLTLDVRVQILYEFLKKGTSNRNIERKLHELSEEEGWQAWSVIHFYGFDGNSKAKYQNLTLNQIKESLENVNIEELEEYHLAPNEEKEALSNIRFTDSDGKDVFRNIKTRQGQYKLRKVLIRNYQSKCALCNIKDPKLLITSHIKTWSESTAEERINPGNSILLCKLHDGLFEYGYISLTDDFNVLYSSTFDFEGQGLTKNLTFNMPVNNPPLPNFLKSHRIKHGYE
jgi:hypothetical protein